MRGRRFERLRKIGITRDRLAAVLLICGIQATIYYVEHVLGKPLPLKIHPGEVLLLVACLLHGIGRATRTHPCFDGEYLAWLRTTPWTSAKPLPQGPVHLVWEDAVIMSFFAIVSLILPAFVVPKLILTAFAAYLAVITLSLWITDASGHGYLCALGLGFVVLYLKRAEIALAICLIVYVIAFLGLRRSLANLSWALLTLPRAKEDLLKKFRQAQIGWPYQRIMADVSRNRLVNSADAVLCVLLGAFWLYACASLAFNPAQRQVLLALVLCFAPLITSLVRLSIYTLGYVSPISFWGRLFTLRPLVPRYDVVFLTPLLAVACGIAALAAFWGRVPDEITLLVPAAVAILVNLLGPPGLRRWRLTGGHRLVAASEIKTNKQLYVEAS